jgi:hypothetical protein
MMSLKCLGSLFGVQGNLNQGFRNIDRIVLERFERRYTRANGDYAADVIVQFPGRSVVPGVVCFSPQLIDWVVRPRSAINETFCPNVYGIKKGRGSRCCSSGLPDLGPIEYTRSPALGEIR